jgi:beta-lactamase class A
VSYAQAQASGHSAATVARSAAELLYGEPGVYGVVFMEADGTMLYKHNADLPFIAASLYKLVLMVDFYSRRERNEISFDDVITLEASDFPVLNDPQELEDYYFNSSSVGMQFTIRELMEAMITSSSNVAARAFLRMTNTINLNHIAHDMGMVDTHILVPFEEIAPWPSEAATASHAAQTQEALDFVARANDQDVINLTTPADIATFYLLLANRELISEAVSEEMDALLARQVINDRLPFLLPEGTICSHKTGNLIEIVHDAGIVYGLNGPTIVVALSENVPDDARAAAVIQRLGLIAYGATDLPPIPQGTADATSD